MLIVCLMSTVFYSCEEEDAGTTYDGTYAGTYEGEGDNSDLIGTWIMVISDGEISSDESYIYTSEGETFSISGTIDTDGNITATSTDGDGDNFTITGTISGDDLTATWSYDDLDISGTMTGSKVSTDEEETLNYFAFGDTEYDLNWGKFTNSGLSGASDGSYDVELILASSELTDENADGEYDNVNGVDAIIFQLNCVSGTDLEEGVYTYSSDTEEAGTWNWGEYLTNASYDSITDTTTYDFKEYITNGTVTVSISGSTYIIEIDCTDEEGNAITGYYKGSLDYAEDFSGEDEEEDEEETTNYFAVDDSEFELNYGIIEYYEGYSENENSYNTDLTLLSSELTDEDGDGAYEYNNIDVIYFELYSSISNGLDEGTYTYDVQSYDASTYDYAEYMTNYSYDYSTGEESYDNYSEIIGGTITVSKSDDTYTIDIDCYNEDGNAIIGHYEGTLDYVIYADEDEVTSSVASLKTTKAKKLRFKKVE